MTEGRPRDSSFPGPLSLNEEARGDHRAPQNGLLLTSYCVAPGHSGHGRCHRRVNESRLAKVHRGPSPSEDQQQQHFAKRSQLLHRKRADAFSPPFRLVSKLFLAGIAARGSAGDRTLGACEAVNHLRQPFCREALQPQTVVIGVNMQLPLRNEPNGSAANEQSRLALLKLQVVKTARLKREWEATTGTNSACAWFRVQLSTPRTAAAMRCA